MYDADLSPPSTIHAEAVSLQAKADEVRFPTQPNLVQSSRLPFPSLRFFVRFRFRPSEQ